ncbi:MAG: hypothetical protein ACTSQO_00160 [Candidatus Helarchaeota archaeon]
MIDLIKENVPYLEIKEKQKSSIDPTTIDQFMIPRAKSMELEGLEDLINLISTVMVNNFSLYHYKQNDRHIYFVYVVIHDFYNFRGIPLLIYTFSDYEPDLFLKYQPNRNPIIKMTSKFEDANAVYIKIIKVKKLPQCLNFSY